MDRYWHFTWRTYGTWLPGTPGFVGDHVPDGITRVSANRPGHPTAEPQPALARYAAAISADPVGLTPAQAAAVARQLRETAAYRGRLILAAAVLVNHVHLVFGTPGDPDPDQMLADWKAWASRALNRLAGWAAPAPRPVWWERDGSKRPLKGGPARASAVRYARDQDGPLVVWVGDEAADLLAAYPAPGEPRA